MNLLNKFMVMVSQSIWMTLPLVGICVADSYPARPVRWIAPFPPGSSIDVTGRVFAPKFTELLGQNFLVDNRPGAAGNVGAEIVAHAPADGYTLLGATTPLAASAALFAKLSFDPRRDFVPISMLTSTSYLLVVRPSLGIVNLKDMIARAKADPSKFTYASVGIGSTAHLLMESIKSQTGINLVHVPYKGSSFVMPDLIGGQVDYFFASTQALVPQVKAGRLRALGITALKRNIHLPEIPTIAESGVPRFEATNWVMLLAPAKTPKSVINTLNKAIFQLSQSADVNEQINALGASVVVNKPDQAALILQEEIKRWSKVVLAANIKPE
jgi:tripartite-type tricarboxylate transporter receptor subunit TctC